MEEKERKKSDEILKHYMISELTNIEFSAESIRNNCFVLSNSNKTVEKFLENNNKADGIRCTERPLFGSSDKKVFSIKLEKLTTPFIIIGFGVKTADHSNGFINTSSSFMLNLFNGNFFSRSKYEPQNDLQNFQQASVNQIYTTILDIGQKNMKFLLNGEALGEPIMINLKPKEIDLII